MNEESEGEKGGRKYEIKPKVGACMTRPVCNAKKRLRKKRETENEREAKQTFAETCAVCNT